MSQSTASYGTVPERTTGPGALGERFNWVQEREAIVRSSSSCMLLIPISYWLDSRLAV
jgi:hypothetical protein